MKAWWQRFIITLLIGSFCLPVPAHAYNVQYGAIVIDAATGRVLHSESADAITYPASLTKMMTLYLLFEALESKRLQLNSQFRASSHATNQAPSKLGLKVGEHIQVRDAMMALIVKSANDVAVAVAEGIAGSEAAFAQLMTKKAQELGMRNSTFKNASGLPNKHQKTTARDMAILGYALYKHFPKYYKYFKTQSFWYKGTEFKSHNRLVGKVIGCDGIKTGFINASGFNLVSSAKRNNKRFIVAVLGGKTSRERDKRSAELIELAFQHSTESLTKKAPTVYASTENDTRLLPFEELNQLVEKVDGATLLDEEIVVAAAPSGSMSGVKIQPAKTIKKATKTAKDDGLEIQLASKARLPRAENTWSIQVGSFSKARMAEAAAVKYRRKLQLSFEPNITVSNTAYRGKKKTFRVRLSGFNEKQAVQACKKLQRQGNACMVIRPHKEPKLYTAMN